MDYGMFSPLSTRGAGLSDDGGDHISARGSDESGRLRATRDLTSANRRAAIAVLAVKVKPPSAVASRTLTAPLGLTTMFLWCAKAALGPLRSPKEHGGNKPRRRDAVMPKAPKRSEGVAKPGQMLRICLDLTAARRRGPRDGSNHSHPTSTHFPSRLARAIACTVRSIASPSSKSIATDASPAMRPSKARHSMILRSLKPS